jgi:hypothetical protein
MIISVTNHSMFHIRWIPVLKSVCSDLFSASSSYNTFLSDGIVASVNKHSATMHPSHKTFPWDSINFYSLPKTLKYVIVLRHQKMLLYNEIKSNFNKLDWLNKF